ncbi:MAG TPA: single-stranded DNA-binding protein [Saprospiraceae bacterium]|nr:single-stranded DNA-binding protein [Saprospiraceae bacterium]
MINKVILVGNLGRDPEVRHLENGGMMARFSIATNESRRDKNGQWQKYTEWHDITAWGVLAERVAQQIHKGSLVYIEGKITHRKWQDREGRDRFSTDIIANVMRSLDKREGPKTAYDDEAPVAPEEEMQGMNPEDDLPF